jgi:hypothetical protein
MRYILHVPLVHYQIYGNSAVASPEFNNHTEAFQQLFLVAFELTFRLNSLLPFIHQLSRRCCSNYKLRLVYTLNFLPFQV